MDRIIFLIDMDCFYVQVEQRQRPETVGLPCAVIQYTSLSSASLIAVSYEARERGVTRNMSGDAARKQCSELLLFQVPVRRSKADLTKYREAGAEVVKSISKFTSKIERASIDEAYIDATDLLSSDIPESTISLEKSNLVVDPETMKNVVGVVNPSSPPCSLSINDIEGQMVAIGHLCDGVKLRQALCLAQKVKDQIFADTGFRCSIGIASNRMVAKIACSLNKPNKITLVPLEAVQYLMNFTKVRKVPGLGGKLGKDLTQQFNIEFIGSLREVPVSRLNEVYGVKTSKWLYELCRGRDYQAVSVRTLVKSIACSKNFLGKSALKTDDEVNLWLTNLTGELVERIAIDRSDNARLPTAITVCVRVGHSDAKSKSLDPSLLASIPPRAQEPDEKTEGEIAKKVALLAFVGIRSLVGSAPITNIGLTAGKFKSDHSVTCGNVEKLLKGDRQPFKQESFFRQFIESNNDESTPKIKPIADDFPLQYVEKEVQNGTSSGKVTAYFQRHDASAETVLCQECGSRILVQHMPEHLDFHLASKIQKEWNRETNQTATFLQTATASKPIRGGRRRERVKREVRHAKIDSFFTKRI